MAEDQGKEEEKFDFTGEGEAVGYISLAQARLLAMEHARDNTDFYGPSYVGFSLVWEVANTEETDEYYDVRLSFRPAGRFRGEPGLEQLIFDKTGNLRMRQLLDEPTELGDTVDSESLPPSATSPVVIPTTVASDEPSPVPELSMPNTAVNIARWRTQINRELEINREVVSSPGIAYTFQLEWGSVGRRDGQFNSPHGIAVDGAGEVYVTDIGNHRVQVFDANGQLLRKWGSEGRGDSQFRFPAGIAVDGAVSIYVADNHGERVQVFDANGRLLRKWWSEEGNNRPLGKRENFGNTPGQFNNPYGVAVEGAGAVYVVDTKNHRLLVFDNNGSFLADWGSEGRSTGQFRFPAGIAVDGAGNVYVADTGNRRVQVFDNNGGFLAEWGTEGSDDGQFKGPSGIAVDGAGRVYVVDTGNRRVQVFDDNGHFLANWGTEGNGVGQFKGPSGIAVDGAGNIYVVDTGNNRVQVFSQVR